MYVCVSLPRADSLKLNHSVIGYCIFLIDNSKLPFCTISVFLETVLVLPLLSTSF